MKTNAIRTAIAAAGVATAIAAAPPAGADPSQDAEFIQLLSAHGMTYDNPGGAVAEARQVCGMLSIGDTPATVVRDILAGGMVSPDEATWIVRASVMVYCPWNNASAPTSSAA